MNLIKSEFIPGDFRISYLKNFNSELKYIYNKRKIDFVIENGALLASRHRTLLAPSTDSLAIRATRNGKFKGKRLAFHPEQITIFYNFLKFNF